MQLRSRVGQVRTALGWLGLESWRDARINVILGGRAVSKGSGG
jgi:hypothetical protein